MVSPMCKAFFLFVFFLPDVLLSYATDWPIFIEDSEGNRQYMGLLPGGKRLPEKEVVVGLDEALPESFDTREKWPECINITGLIRNQGMCGSCWAFSVAEVISDRICIKSKGATQVVISPEDLMTCCDDKNGCYGCDGGSDATGLQYWVDAGIVTGGEFESQKGCRPYTIPDEGNERKTQPCNKTCEEGHPIDYSADKHYSLKACIICNHNLPQALEYWVHEGIVTGGEFASHKGCRPYTIPDEGGERETPPCNKTCEKGYSIDYTADKHYGLKAYSIKADEKQIQQEIYENGPVCAAMYVYDGFIDHKSGVYRHPTPDEGAVHAIKIIGWGVEDGTPYWLCANCWGVKFGEKGYFKILRGDQKNNCNIEKYILAGIPKL